MHRQNLLIAVLLVGSLGPAGVVFEAPAAVWGDVAGNHHSWILILLGPEDDLAADLAALASVEVVNRTVVHSWVWEPATNQGSSRYRSLPPGDPVILESLVASLSAVPGMWTSLFIRGDISFTATNASGLLHAGDASQSMDLYVPEGIPLHSYRAALRPSDGPTLALRGDLAFSFQAQGPLVVEWHEMQLACQAACIDGAHATSVRHAGAVEVEAKHLPYIQIAFDGTASGQGTATAIVAGGPLVDLAVEGTVRLPLAQCDACNGTQTIRLEGDVLLEDLALQGGGFAGSVSGDYTGALLDEQVVDPSAVGGRGAETVVLAVAGTAALLVLARFVSWLALLVRNREVALSNDSRRRILELVKQNPGVSQRELHRLSGYSRSTIEKHAAVLQRVGKLDVATRGNTYCYYPKGRMSPNEKHALAALRNENLAQLHAALAAMGRVTQAEATAHAQQAFGWSTSTTQYRLQRLEQSALVRSWREGGRRWYEAQTIGSD